MCIRDRDNIVVCTKPVGAEMKCCSCGTTELEEWSPAPWQTNLTSSSVVKKLCKLCYKNFRLSRTRCNDDKCLTIPTRSQYEELENRGEELNCFKCGGIMKLDSKMEVLYGLIIGSCGSCNNTQSSKWRTHPIYKQMKGCSGCMTKYYNTRTICGSISCLHIHSLKEAAKIRLNYRRFQGVEFCDISTLECIKCRFPVNVDTSRPLAISKMKMKPGTCQSCSRIEDKKWRPVPWSKFVDHQMQSNAMVIFLVQQQDVSKPPVEKL